MKRNIVRMLVPAAVLLASGIGFVITGGLGTFSTFGWGDVSIICPLGALGTMLASKTVLPRAVLSLVIAAIAIVLLGRAFCGWLCPVPLVSKLKDLFAKDRAHDRERSKSDKVPHSEGPTMHASPMPVSTSNPTGKTAASSAGGDPSPSTPMKAVTAKPLSEAEKDLLASSCGARRPTWDSRHLILGGALASTAVFGFPVFCLVCPIGLSFATVFLIIRLFGAGDISWTVIAVPVLLVIEVVFFRKWCSRVCPLGALMSLVGKANRTFQPQVDGGKCLESKPGAVCGRCAKVCAEGIDRRHPELSASASECTRCMKCVDACPTQAISIKMLAKESAPAAIAKHNAEA